MHVIRNVEHSLPRLAVVSVLLPEESERPDELLGDRGGYTAHKCRLPRRPVSYLQTGDVVRAAAASDPEDGNPLIHIQVADDGRFAAWARAEEAGAFVGGDHGVNDSLGKTSCVHAAL